MNLAIDIATLIAVVVGFTSLIVTIRNFRKGTYVQVITTYAERFEKLMDLFPPGIFFGDLDELPPQDSDLKLRLTCMKYFNLTFEEFYLYNKGYFPKDLWKMWEADIKDMLAHPLLKREWDSIKETFEQHEAFYTFVEQVHKKIAASKSA